MITGQKIISDSVKKINKSYKITEKQIEEIEVLKKETKSRSYEMLFDKLIFATKKAVEDETKATKPETFKRTHYPVKKERITS